MIITCELKLHYVATPLYYGEDVENYESNYKITIWLPLKVYTEQSECHSYTFLILFTKKYTSTPTAAIKLPHKANQPV